MSIWKQFLGSLVRWLLGVVFGILVSKGIITQDTVPQLLDSAVGIIVMAIIAMLPLIWSWAKARFTYYFSKEAIAAKPFDTVSEVKQKVFDKIKMGTSI